MKRRLLLALPLLAACGSKEGDLVWNSAMDELRGAPSAAQLEASERFVGGGLSFDYPAVLRLRPDFSPDGDRQWNLEYGMYSLDVHAPKREMTAEDFLGGLEELFAGGDSIDAEPLEHGEPVTLCGAPRVPVILRMKMMGDWSRLVAFDLPAPEGESRVLVFDDELVAGKPSALGEAVYERVIGTLACTPR